MMLAALFAFLLGGAPCRIEADGAPGAKVELEKSRGGISVRIASQEPLTFVRLKWKAGFPAGAKFFGGDWERTYGDTRWTTLADSRPMPWYFLCSSADGVSGCGVKVQPGAFASWVVSSGGVELVLDCRCGSDPVRLGGRVLDACTIVERPAVAGESAFAAGQALCRLMCENPRFPAEPVYGYNDWYCAYGRNTAENFLSDAREVLSLAKGLANRPYAVVDDGWQASDSWRDVNARWGMPMEKVASRIEAMDAKPGLWYRPLKHFASDPTLAEVKRTIVGDIETFRRWGYKLLKIDFITYDWNHSWNPLGVSPVVRDDLHWADRTRTTAETIRGLYRAMRSAAGDGIVIIGCNALDHFAAGLFEVQRTGDDTSGCDWALTAKCGPNALGMRAHHHGTFYAQDGDCAGLAFAGGVDWELNSMWIDLLSRSAGAFFVSWFRDILDDNVKAALAAAFERASKVQAVAEPLDWMERADPCVWNCSGEKFVYDWKPKVDAKAKVTKFLVLGDVHYCNYDDNGDPTPARMNRLAADLARKNAQFDFVMQVGDIVNCQTGRVARSLQECREEWRYAFSEMKRLFPDKPVLITPGNHDWYGAGSWQGGGPCIRELYIPFTERELGGVPLNGLPFFTFRANDVMFIFLNHLGMDKGVDIECTKMLRKAIASADSDASISRVFVFSHPEIWNVNYFRFNENAGYLPDLMAARKMDAYFSGHVHMNIVTARKNDYGMALRQICAAGVWPPVKEGPKRFHAVPSMQLNPLPSKRLFSDFPADVESYILVEASKEKVVVRFEEVGGGVLGEYEWKGPYDLDAVKRAPARFPESLPQQTRRARLWYYPLFVDRLFSSPAAPRFRVNGRDVGEVKRNYSFFHSNWGRFYIDIPVDLVRKENKVEIVNPLGERFLLRDLSIMAAGADGVEHFTPVHGKMISFGDWRTFYMGFGLVHENMGILHSDIETNASSEVIEVVPGSRAAPYSVELNFR